MIDRIEKYKEKVKRGRRVTVERLSRRDEGEEGNWGEEQKQKQTETKVT